MSSLNLPEAKVGYQIRDALRAEVEASAAAYRFDESEDRRRDEQRLRGGLSWRVFPRTSVFGEVGHAVFDYVDRPEQDGTATHAALGLSWDVTARSVGSVKAGLQRKSCDAEDPGRGTEDTDTWIVTG